MILALGKDNYQSFKNIENLENIIVLYKELLTKEARNLLKKKNTYSALSTALFFLTDKNFIRKKECDLCSKIFINLNTGDLSIVGPFVTEIPNFLGEEILYEKVGLLQGRLYDKFIVSPKLVPLYSNCPQKILNLKKIGNGSYANVYKTDIATNDTLCNKNIEIAIKISKIKPEAVFKLFSSTNISWREIYIMQNIITPLLEKRMCPNLPLLYDAFFCKRCEINIQKKNLKIPCAITAVELAKEDLKSFLNKKRTEAEITSVLFQIMAGLHAIQLYGQLVNFDIKKENILIFSVKPGGYWKYVIHDQEFFVPNLGFFCVLNDFGVSRSFSPSFLLCKNEEDCEYKLGNRRVLLDKGKFIPITYRDNAEEFFIKRSNDEIFPKTTVLSQEIIDILNYRDLTLNCMDKEFFLFSEIIPPLEFYNDLQDVLRTFTGGKRTTQKGNHGTYKYLSKEFIEKLKKYQGPLESFSKGSPINDIIPEQVLASYFILDFFGEYRGVIENKKIIETYMLS